MKKIVGVSLGSSKRNHRVLCHILGQKMMIERVGTDGNLDEAIAILSRLDGKVDAFGIGGIDLYIHAGGKRYFLRDGRKMANAVKKTPIVDGSGLKNTLERKVVKYLHNSDLLPLNNRKVLLVCAVDRFGMAEEMYNFGAKVVLGDLIFGLGIPIPIHSLEGLDRLVRLLAPLVGFLPTKYLYPSGSGNKVPSEKAQKYYHWAEIIAGDFHYIKRHMPERMDGKIVVTNTVTASDIDILKQRGIAKLITTTPEFNGRSFGTNVMEALMVALLDKPTEQITPTDYLALIDRLGFEPRVLNFTKQNQKDSLTALGGTI
ncbi:MAG: quinate 5-dehydrogenase [Clostridia bacterium]|nr:quinate 5-dehydrogenase [Clostridia bacterium]